MKEKEAKEIVDKFIDMCTIKKDYEDWCNCQIEMNPDDRISFWPAYEMIFINLDLAGEFKKERVQKKIKERQEEAKDWLKNEIKKHNTGSERSGTS